MFGEYNPQGAARNIKQAGESERLSSYKLETKSSYLDFFLPCISYDLRLTEMS